MEDRELLELAAKAAGIEVIRTDQQGLWIAGGCGDHWNPLKDDGEALRLAIKLDIHIKRFAGATTCQEWTGLDAVTEHDHWSANYGEPIRSTRLAIVRAAAKIGEAMQ